MADTPLKAYLVEIGQTAEQFAVDHDLSPWNVRHWTRGDKEPSLNSKLDIERATGGKVTPSMWLEWKIATRPTDEVA